MYHRTGRAVIGRSETRSRRGQMRLVEADSTWEVKAAYDLDQSPMVKAWVKNDPLGLEVIYIFEDIRPQVPARCADPAGERYSLMVLCM